MNPNLFGSPIERATVGADRSAARTAMAGELSARIAAGYQTCRRCRRRQATSFAENPDGPRDDGAALLLAVCDPCKTDIELDQQIARQRVQRERMRRA